MGLRKRGFCPLFDTAHENYTWLKHYVEEMQESLSAYALQVNYAGTSWGVHGAMLEVVGVRNVGVCVRVCGDRWFLHRKTGRPAHKV